MATTKIHSLVNWLQCICTSAVVPSAGQRWVCMLKQPRWYTVVMCLFLSVFSPSLKVEQLCDLRGNERCPHGSPSDLRGNFVGPLHLEKSVDLLRIHTHRGHSHLLACQRGLSSQLLLLTVDMDPSRIAYCILYFKLNICGKPFIIFCHMNIAMHINKESRIQNKKRIMNTTLLPLSLSIHSPAALLKSVPHTPPVHSGLFDMSLWKAKSITIFAQCILFFHFRPIEVRVAVIVWHRNQITNILMPLLYKVLYLKATVE